MTTNGLAMTSQTQYERSLFTLEDESWSEEALESIDSASATALVCGRIQQALYVADTHLTVDEIITETGLTEHRVEDALEILTRERTVAVTEDNGELVFCVDAKERPDLGGERLVLGDYERIFEVDAVESRGEYCLKITEKCRWEEDYEHTVGGVVIPSAALDYLFSMMNTIDERFVYETTEN